MLIEEDGRGTALSKGEGVDKVALVCILLACACICDYRDKRIPNWVILFLFMSILGIADNWLSALLQIISMVAILYFFFKIGTLGAGDVKLFGVCAGIFPTEKILIFLFVSLLIAAIFSIVKLLQEQNMRERLLYLYEYLVSVLQNGAWGLYIKNEKERRRRGVCLSGPILCSVLLYLGGAY